MRKVTSCWHLSHWLATRSWRTVLSRSTSSSGSEDVSWTLMLVLSSASSTSLPIHLIVTKEASIWDTTKRKQNLVKIRTSQKVTEISVLFFNFQAQVHQVYHITFIKKYWIALFPFVYLAIIPPHFIVIFFGMKN